MKKESLRVLKGWLHSRRVALGLFLAFSLLCFIIYPLYGEDLGVPLYTVLFCGAVAAVVAVFDLVRWARRLRELEKLAGRYPTGKLPEPASAVGAAYTGVILALEEERARLEAEAAGQKKEDRDWYTLWMHQIKLPIAGMRLLLQQEAGMDAGLRGQMEQELFRTEQYVGMALQYQRLSSIRSDLDFEEQELGVLVRQAVKNMAPLFILKKLPLELQELDMRVVTDAKWLVFVLEQILANALKYTAKGKIGIYMEGAYTLVIEDTGIGIRAEDLPRLFERGYTGATGRAERQATGLGLYLCHEILEKLGFGIQVESQPGVGTRVLLDLCQQRQELD